MKFKLALFALLLSVFTLNAAQTPLYVGRFTGNGAGLTNLPNSITNYSTNAGNRFILGLNTSTEWNLDSSSIKEPLFWVANDSKTNFQILSDGGVYLGHNAFDVWFGSSDDILTAIRCATNGEASRAYGVFGVVGPMDQSGEMATVAIYPSVQVGSFGRSAVEIAAYDNNQTHGGKINLEVNANDSAANRITGIEIKNSSGNVRTLINPQATNGLALYNFDSFSTILTGNLLSVANNTTNIFGVAYNGIINGNGGGLTNLALYASNVLAGGQLPLGTVAANTGTNGNILMFDGTSRVWSNTPALATIYSSATLNSLGGTNLFNNGNLTNRGRADIAGNLKTAQIEGAPINFGTAAGAYFTMNGVNWADAGNVGVSIVIGGGASLNFKGANSSVLINGTISATNGSTLMPHVFITNTTLSSLLVPVTVTNAASTNYLQYNYSGVGPIYEYCHTNYAATNSWTYRYLLPTTLDTAGP